jgi:hypothetical protein
MDALVMRDGGDDDLVALNGIDHVVRKTAEDKFTKFIINRITYARLRCTSAMKTTPRPGALSS